MKKRLHQFQNYMKQTKVNHVKFRSSYVTAQAHSAIVLGVLTLIYSALCYFFLDHMMQGTIEHLRQQYLALFFVSVVSIGITVYGKLLSYKVKEKVLDTYYEVIFFIIACLYIAWGFMAMYFSMIEKRVTNYLPIFIIFAVCVGYFYFRVVQYIILYVGSLTLCFTVVLSLKGNGQYDEAVLFNSVMLGAVLTVAGIIKYATALRRYIIEKEAEALRKSVEDTNERLIRNNENLIAITEELKKKNEGQFLFTSSMNHELRSPLNGTIGILQILYDDNTLTEEQHDYVDKALISSKTLIQIVNDLLDYAKLEIGQFQIVEEPFDIRKLVHEIEVLSLAQAEKKQLVFSAEVDAGVPYKLIGDSVRMKQIITNLVSNGIKYTERGYVKVVIDMEAGEQLRIMVIDSGQGMSEEALEKLFDPFTRFNEKKNKYIQGTGLGLNIVNSLVKGMNGYIEVKSTLNHGTIFTVHIPAKAAENTEGYSVEWLEEKKEEVPMMYGHTFLCVDDTKVNLAVFKGLMKPTYGTVKTASSGQEALDILKNEKFDMIFLDHMMPGMDGLETFARIKEEKLAEGIPVIMLTANAGPEAEALYINQGFYGFLFKPLLKEELYKKLIEGVKPTDEIDKTE